MSDETKSPLIVGGELILYGYVGGSPHDEWFKGFTGQHVVDALAELEGDITVRINSGGGSVWDGLATYNALAGYDGNVTVKIDGVAASAASFIMLAGTEVIAPASSLIMIHNASSITVGDAADHEHTAEMLRKIDQQITEMYAAKSGKSFADCAKLMDAETWFTGTEAVEHGLADTTGVANANDEDDNEAAATAAASFPYEIYAQTPDALRGAASAVTMATRDALATAGLRLRGQPTAAQRPKPAASAAPPTPTEAPIMSKDAATPKKADTPVDAKAIAANAVKAERERVSGIQAACKAAKMSEKFTADMIDSDISLADAREKIINTLADNDNETIDNRTRVEMGADSVDKFKSGVEKALMSKAGIEGGERNEFTSLTLLDIARMSLSQRNIKVRGDRMEVAKVALNPHMAGYHSTDDFVEILGNVAERSMLRGYGESPETYSRFTARGTLSDFKIATRIDIGEFPELKEVPEGAEYKAATVSERKAMLQLATYGRKIAFTRQAIINDDMDLFSRLPRKMGRAASRTVGNLVWAIITGNVTLDDGIKLFHADHNNLASSGGAPSVATLTKMKTAMALHKDDDDIVTALNIRPEFLVVPVALESTGSVLVASEFDPSKTQRVPNPHRSTLAVLSDGRLDAHSAAAWYGFANPNTTDTIEVSYLDGNDQPVLERRDGWDVDGVEMKVRLDAGVSALDYRGAYKNPGAA